jgi:hypothetical protein
VWRTTGWPASARATADRASATDRADPWAGPVEAGSLDFADPSASLLGRAFMSLQERWRAAAWLTAIEQASAEETTAIFGPMADGVAVFAEQALAALTEAYLGVYLSIVTRGDCKSAAGALGIDVDGTMSRPDEWTARHLRGCVDCQAMVAELGDLSRSLRRVVAPIFLGSAATAYLSGIGHSAVPDGEALSGRHSMRQVRARGRRTSGRRRMLVAGGTLLAVLAITGLALALVVSAAPGRQAGRRAMAGVTAPSSAAARPASPTLTRPAAPAPRHSRDGTQADSPSDAPTTPAPATSAPPQSPPPSPSPTLGLRTPLPCPTEKICPM